MTEKPLSERIEVYRHNAIRDAVTAAVVLKGILFEWVSDARSLERELAAYKGEYGRLKECLSDQCPNCGWPFEIALSVEHELAQAKEGNTALKEALWYEHYHEPFSEGTWDRFDHRTKYSRCHLCDLLLGPKPPALEEEP